MTFQRLILWILRLFNALFCTPDEDHCFVVTRLDAKGFLLVLIPNRTNKNLALCYWTGKLMYLCKKNVQEMTQEHIAALERAVEDQYGQTLSSPADFGGLCDSLKSTLGESLSMSTVKRLWGYVSGYESVRKSTLNTLSHYVGCRDWEDFCATLEHPDVSTFPTGDVVALSTLKVGDGVEVTWSPGRRIVVQYLGQGRMRVTESLRSKLTVGTTFSCAGMVNSERLTLTQVEIPGTDQALTYVCGKRGGITARVIPVNDLEPDAR